MIDWREIWEQAKDLIAFAGFLSFGICAFVGAYHLLDLVGI